MLLFEIYSFLLSCIHLLLLYQFVFAQGLLSMTSHIQGMGEEGSGKRRAHKKSRRGCRNCKLRRIKVSHIVSSTSSTVNRLLQCDETWPKCNRCTSFRVSCNYDPKAPDLQISIDGTESSTKDPGKALCFNKVPSRMNVLSACLYPALMSDKHPALQLDRDSWERLGRFEMRTVLTIGPITTSETYQKVTIKLAWAVSVYTDCLIYTLTTFLMLSIPI